MSTTHALKGGACKEQLLFAGLVRRVYATRQTTLSANFIGTSGCSTSPLLYGVILNISAWVGEVYYTSKPQITLAMWTTVTAEYSVSTDLFLKGIYF